MGVGPAAFGAPGGSCTGVSGVNSQGLERLDSELHGICAKERLQRATSGDSLHRLSEDGPWRLSFAETYEAFQLVEQLRERNDALAKDLATCRWQRLHEFLPPSLSGLPLVVSSADGASFYAGPAACSAFTSSPSPSALAFAVGGSPAPGTMPGGSSRRPLSAPCSRGPRFRSPAELLASKPPMKPCASSVASGKVLGWTASDESLASSSMPKAVVSDAKEWEASGRSPPKKEKENGLAYLLGGRGAAERFRPGGAIPAGFGASKLCDTPTAPCVEQPEYPKVRRPKGAAELARQAAAKFAEPLSAALGTPSPLRASSAPRGRTARSSQASNVTDRPNHRTPWVTFHSPVKSLQGGEGPAEMLSEPIAGLAKLPLGGNGFAPLDTIANALTQEPRGAALGATTVPVSGPEGWADDLEFRSGGGFERS